MSVGRLIKASRSSRLHAGDGGAEGRLLSAAHSPHRVVLPVSLGLKCHAQFADYSRSHAKAALLFILSELSICNIFKVGPSPVVCQGDLMYVDMTREFSASRPWNGVVPVFFSLLM